MLDQHIFLADNSRIEVDGAWFSELVTRENVSDLKNGRLTGLLGFEGSYTNILVGDEDTLPLYRLNQANKSLIYLQELGLTTPIFTKSAINDKRRLIGSMFPEKFDFESLQHRTALVIQKFQLIYLIKNKLEVNKKGQKIFKNPLPCKGTHMGLEPKNILYWLYSTI
ncbi:hypothetical protein SAMN05421827_12527 [Pedobacter terrae]|uniref:Uncharacterized protein n=1 Tax=Pedobacter terrae TaxID=405671 RepID=A0A1G8CK06_9SPHI|nr:hypothetical protein [Pedobacter terrae]SDH45821.1 hypothetical protein SAMN05421827_12527 [Pedobacter terrae]